jgi:hypothetical protein
MTYKSSLLGGAAVGVVLALCLGVTAQAATTTKHHHHKAAAPAAPKPDPKEEEIQELKAENAALNQRLSAVESQQAATAATAAQAQAAAAQAQAAQVAQADQIKRIPGEVETKVSAKIPKPVTGWWSNTTVGGTVFADLSNIDVKSNGVKPAGSANGTNFDIKRFYIVIDHKFNNVFSANLTTDFNYDSGPAAATQLYIKKAYLQAKLADALTVRLGSADLPWVPYVEGLYGYRYVENVLVDRTKYGTSADWGVHLLGTVPLGMLNVSYAGSAVNGQGYKVPGFVGGVNRTQDMDFEGRLSASIAGFNAAVGGYDGKQGKAVEGVVTYRNYTRFDALVAYVQGPIRIGGEYFEARANKQETLAPPAVSDRAVGYSGFASFQFTKEFALFGRYDWVKPKDNTLPPLNNHYFNVGLQYEPVKVVDLSLVYKRDAINNGVFGDQNFTPPAGNIKGTYDEIGLFTQFKW